jgi:Ca-activated chloride channel homolog
MKKFVRLLSGLLIAPCFATFAHAAGTLTPAGSPHQPVQIRDHQVDVDIIAGFARTEVTQTFFNPNTQDLEAVYSFPVPKSASLSEFSITSGEERIDGEVVPKAKANQIYEEEVANKNSYQNFEFKVSRVRAQNETRIRFVYYQPLTIDTGVGRYVYPLEDGGTDDVVNSFWTANTKVENTFSANINLLTAYPIEDVRVPGYETGAALNKKGPGEYEIKLTNQGASLNRDLVVYYRLAANAPAGIELIPYRPDPAKPGTFMLITTPGVDLQPLTGGADYVFVLDTSGSMQGKIQTLARGVKQALGEMKPDDRYRVVLFNDSAQELTNGWVPATKENVLRTATDLEQLQAAGSTNIYDGLEKAMKSLDQDRVTSVILVTDGVTNTGILDPKEFAALVKKYDIRLFGFLLGNGSNWPLMQVITESSGGFYAPVSNSDDIVGQLVLAKSKIRFEALHDAVLNVKGVKTFDVTDENLGKVYRGEQLVMFGRYEEAGEGTVTLHAALSGEDKVYSTKVNFPAIATTHPEIERLWAMNRIEEIELQEQLGKVDATEGAKAIEDLGVAYQLVTDETSMLVLSDGSFNKHGITRSNKSRVATEQQARAVRASEPVQSYTVPASKPMFDHSAPSLHLGGGGAVDPFSALAFGVPLLILATKKRKGEGE